MTGVEVAAPAEAQEVDEVDVVIVGAGPAGALLSKLLAERYNRSVCIIDPKASRPWPNNYGVWQEEWDALEAKLNVGLSDCLGAQWTMTDCYFGGSWEIPVDERLRLGRGYGRVDRQKLKATLQSPRVRVLDEALNAEAVATNIYSGGGLRHHDGGSIIQLSSNRVLHAKMVVDATGSESRLTRRISAAGEPPSPAPGFQIAYGFECLVDGPLHYDPKSMTLFDYRTDHLSFDPAWEARAQKTPTFMYAMPLGPASDGSGAQRVFFEETSLVARPGAIGFEECEKRAMARLKYLGVVIRPGTITDEEFCYIPMGGPVPEPGQRVVAFGGAASMVHPSTGYQLCRMMAAASAVADVLGRELGAPGGCKPDAVAAAAYEAMWSLENQAQRDFAVFGGEFLMTLGVDGLRGWFDGFFRLPEGLWAGFLAGWPTLPGNEHHESWAARLAFGVQLLVRIPPLIALRLVGGILQYSLTYGIPLVRSVTPLFGDPPRYSWAPQLPAEQVGDPAAKREALSMISARRAARQRA